MRHTLSLILVLATIWVLNSGHYTSLLLSLGFISILFVVYLSHKMDVVDEESQPFQLRATIIFYWIWLLKEILMSNLSVAKHIWLGPNSISPSMKKIKVSQSTDMGKVIYANSITLTPGTVTVDIDGETFLVHALTEETLHQLLQGEMDRRVTQLEKS
ncbi:MAG TPA: cation transporter [Gammaproteobacteria bacterium]|nr:cation transporter [Gammaproteobacteria bacterium]